MNGTFEITLETPFFVADWHIEPSLGRVSRGQTVVKLEPKVMAVLVCLAQKAGDVISREQLEATVWAGRVVGYDSLATTIIKLRKAFEDDSRNPQVIETVPKRGYRLIAFVNRVGPAKIKPLTTANTTPETGSIITNFSALLVPGKNKIILLIAAVMLALLIPGLIKITDDTNTNHVTALVNGKLSVAVLPFENISNDPQQDYFSDGMTADLITDLSKISGLGVIARNSTFAYKDSSIDVRQIGKELSVNYVIEGSVRKSNDKVRISARLIDTSNGHNLWAERFDGSLENVFALQDSVTEKIIAALKLKLSDREQQQLARKYTNNIIAYDHFLQGWKRFWEYSKESNALAKEHFRKAIEIDPDFARAYANLALSFAYDVLNGWTNTPDANLKLAEELSQKALELDNDLVQVHWAAAFTALISRNHKLALSESLKVIELDPNNADGYGILATTLNYAAKPKDALEQMRKAMRLNPLHPSVYKVIMGEIYFNLHDYENAIKQFEHALGRNPDAQEPRLWLTASYAHVGRIGDANWQLEQIRLDDPDITIAGVESVIPFIDPTQLKHLVDGLNKAGLK
jgi:TolB-like protein/DNA-binding winged helix-turn-helix (wHTH) protein/Tfp pilus assembly protein PilF